MEILYGERKHIYALGGLLLRWRLLRGKGKHASEKQGESKIGGYELDM